MLLNYLRSGEAHNDSTSRTGQRVLFPLCCTDHCYDIGLARILAGTSVSGLEICRREEGVIVEFTLGNYRYFGVCCYTVSWCETPADAEAFVTKLVDIIENQLPLRPDEDVTLVFDPRSSMGTPYIPLLQERLRACTRSVRWFVK